MKFKHQYDFRGNHRLVVNEKAGGWVSYTGIAELGEYRAMTDYYGESVYKIVPQEATIEGIRSACGSALPKIDAEGKAEGTACEHVQASIKSIEDTIANIGKDFKTGGR